MKCHPFPDLPEVLLLEPRVHRDGRGYFLEIFQSERYGAEGVKNPFVQDNVSYSMRDVIRGLHYQLGRPQAKLVMAVHGEIFDVVVDIRRGSPTFGRWSGAILSGEEGQQIYVPKGFAHGFGVMSESAAVLYKCTDYYAPAEERGIRWDDPGLGIQWPVDAPIVSDKDRAYPFLAQMRSEDLPLYQP
jgi:dTDP-4-dehydrorhamnose 3,5-epimerase